MPTARPLAAVLLVLCLLMQVPAQNGGRSKTKPEPISEMRAAIERYTVDRGSLTRSYPVAMSQQRRERFKKFYEQWLASLTPLDFDSFSQDGKVDYLLFKNHLEYELRQLDIQAQQLSEIQPLIPFAGTIIDLEEARRRMEPINSAKVAATLTELRKTIDERRRTVESLKVKKTVANRAVQATNALRTNLRNWYTFYNGYDPMFTWWNEEPYKSLDQSMTNYPSFIAERLVGIRSEAGQTQAGSTRGPGGPSGGGGGGGGQGGDQAVAGQEMGRPG